MAADFCLDAGRLSTAPDHAVHVGLADGPPRERRPRFPLRRAEQRAFGITCEARALDVRLQVFVEIVVSLFSKTR